jgi:hypothetical protein
VDNNESLYGAANGIDGDQATRANIPSSSAAPWYRVKFDGVECIDQVKWLWGNTGTPVVTWDCNESGCGTCTGHKECDDGRYTATVSAERGSTDGLPRPSGCAYGDTFELRNKPGRGLHVHEIVFIGKDGKGKDNKLKTKLILTSAMEVKSRDYLNINFKIKSNAVEQTLHVYELEG